MIECIIMNYIYTYYYEYIINTCTCKLVYSMYQLQAIDNIRIVELHVKRLCMAL
jgi:hypothetical protein